MSLSYKFLIKFNAFHKNCTNKSYKDAANCKKNTSLHNYKYICIYLHTYMHTYIHTQIHTYIKTYTHIHTYTHTYVYIYIHK